MLVLPKINLGLILEFLQNHLIVATPRPTPTLQDLNKNKTESVRLLRHAVMSNLDISIWFQINIDIVRRSLVSVTTPRFLLTKELVVCYSEAIVTMYTVNLTNEP